MQKTNIAVAIHGLFLAAVVAAGGLGSARYLSPWAPRATHGRKRRARSVKADVWGPTGKSRGGSLNCRRVVGFAK